jgi:hypothetical protein
MRTSSDVQHLHHYQTRAWDGVHHRFSATAIHQRYLSFVQAFSFDIPFCPFLASVSFVDLCIPKRPDQVPFSFHLCISGRFYSIWHFTFLKMDISLTATWAGTLGYLSFVLAFSV